MGIRNCFVPGCSTGHSNINRRNKVLGVKNNSLFKANSESQLQKWRKAIPRKDKVLGKEDRVCELHFPPEDIVRFFETTMPDGTIHRLARGVPLVKEDAVPITFPNLPKYLSKEARKRKAPTERKISEASSGKTEVRDPPEVMEEAIHEGDYLDLLANVALASIPTVVAGCDVEAAYSASANIPTVVSGCDVEPVYSASALAKDLGTIELPNSSWASVLVGTNVVFINFGRNFHTEKTVVISEDLSFKVILQRQEVIIDGLKDIKCQDDVVVLIAAIDKLRVCQGIPEVQRISTKCAGYVTGNTESRKKGRGRGPSSRCFHCNLAKKQLADKERRKQQSSLRRKSLKCALKKCRVKAARLLTKVSELKRHMEELQFKTSTTSQDILEVHIASLPSCQQEAVRACFEASKVVNAKGRRYTRDWVYECLLLRIKSRKAYEHLRSHDILALPSVQTLGRYLDKVKGAYGFQESTFRCMKEKANQLAPVERRGALLIDEMKLAKCVAFDRKTLKVNGFTDLGDHTPLHQVNERGDHALVMMYQPFRGSWVQALSCFLSKGCASSTVLHHLILECIILLENAGFHVDVVVTDGAQWNRTMWKHFGIDSCNSSCGHPSCPSRRLWFSSDFPHLIKNVRNFFVSREETWTPDGIVKLRHWEAIVKLDNPCGFQLKACPDLTIDHIHPRPYQKMNVRRAFQFFSTKVAAAMKFYRSRHPDLVDCDASITIIERLQQLMQSLNSRTPYEALRKGSEVWKALENFLPYFEKWEEVALENRYNFLSGNTALGLKVSIRTALELHHFLEAECGFQYLMTARLNQDALERFFGMMRSACGSNDHPDSILFIQMFRLISTYSLVKPPKGSNISGGDMLNCLMSINDISDPQQRHDKLQTIIDRIIDRGSLDDDIPLVMDNDHNYHVLHSTDFVVYYFSGYVARKSVRFTDCEECLKSLHSDSPVSEDCNAYMAYLSKGNLTYSSERLYNLISVLERKTVEVLSSGRLNVNSVFQLLETVEQIEFLPLVGCRRDCYNLTEAILRFFLFTRMSFACTVANKVDNISQEKARLHRKIAKL